MGGVIEWFDDYKWWMGAASAIMFLVSLAALPVIVVRLPADYLIRRRRPTWRENTHPVVRLALVVGKNLLGALLLAAGLVMLLTPGQGVLAILVSLELLDIPGKRRLLIKLASQPKVRRAINRLRARFGRPPLATGANES